MWELVDRMVNYTVIGPKAENFKPYETLNYVEKLIVDLNEQDVCDYNAGFGRIFKWLTSAIALRK